MFLVDFLVTKIIHANYNRSDNEEAYEENPLLSSEGSSKAANIDNSSVYFHTISQARLIHSTFASFKAAHEQMMTNLRFQKGTQLLKRDE